ncbi:Replication initiation protein OS=Streptomyces rimosus subsp. rimosus (strain ATCC /DSM 40260 / JCM 4667 / NRRL 2234) OX=1265868 GN=SRIM_020200 PE=4 SV=1 [Streptomyces rimosus subsp. rimosus]
MDGPVIGGRAHVFTFGRQLDVRTIRSADFDGGQELTERAVAAYIAKYATKGAETATGALDRPLKFLAELAQLDISDHARRMIPNRLDPRRPQRPGRPPAPRLGPTLGFRGHFSTKSRRYSTTLGALRDARAEWRRAQAAAEAETASDTTLVLAHWVYAGTGLTDAETWLAESRP